MTNWNFEGEAIAPFGGPDAMIANLKAQVFADKELRYLAIASELPASRLTITRASDLPHRRTGDHGKNAASLDRAPGSGVISAKR